MTTAIVTTFASLVPTADQVNATYNAIQNPTALQTAQRDMGLALATLYSQYDTYNTAAQTFAGIVTAVCDAYEAAEAIRKANNFPSFVPIEPLNGAQVPAAIPQVRLNERFDNPDTGSRYFWNARIYYGRP
jgi:hypothetical protein